MSVGPAHRRSSAVGLAQAWASRRARATTSLASWRARAREWRPESVDAAVYGAAALFALLTLLVSTHGDYRQWAEIALGFYAAGAVVSALRARWASPSSRGQIRGVRLVVFAAVAAGATIAPLVTEVVLQATQGGTSHAQPEVTVVENAAHRFYRGQDPYLGPGPGPGHRALAAPPNGAAPYESYFPYLPAMVLFGVPHAIVAMNTAGSSPEGRASKALPRSPTSRGSAAPNALTDPRVLFTGVVLLLALIALVVSPARGESRVRALQLLTVLPTAALPLATGGDDLPVIGFMVVGLVLLQRRWPIAAGLVIGAAASLKFTAWPLMALAIFAAWDRSGRRAIGRYLGAAVVVLLPTTIPVALENPVAFIANVLRYPLGLAGVASPAQSPLPGHLIVTAFPSLRHLLPVLVALGAVSCLVWYLLHRHPRTASEIAGVCGWMMAFGIVLAPATRFGYFMYPLILLTWSVVLRDDPATIFVHDLAVPGRDRLAQSASVIS